MPTLQVRPEILTEDPSVSAAMELGIHILVDGFVGDGMAGMIMPQRTGNLFWRPAVFQMREDVLTNGLTLQALGATAMRPVFQGAGVSQPRRVAALELRDVSVDFSRNG